MNLKPGTLLQNGKYRIENVLGQGSFGITYLATMKTKVGGNLGDMETTVKVAIKEFFMRDLNGREGSAVMTGSNLEIYHNYRKDFIREANNLSKLKYPHIVNVLEFFEENNTTYFSMEYIDGGNLNDYIQSKGCLSELESLENTVQILEALSCMHNNKMLHLYLKPLNIMRRASGDLVLIDFGLSKQFNSDGEPESSTRIGHGTMGYAPLEQSAYKKEDGFCPYIDIYALGGTLYKMLTGIAPPDASTIFNEGFPEDIMIAKGIGKDVISLTQKAMEPMKKKRIQTTSEFINEVNRILPYASAKCSDKTDVIYESSAKYADSTLELCNGFAINWSVSATEFEKNKIRDLLSKMFKIGEKKQFIQTEYGMEEMRAIPVMSLGLCSTDYLYPILEGEDTVGYFPPTTVNNILRFIQRLSQLTGLSFRLSDKEEIIISEQTAATWFWESLKTLCYSKSKKLQYKTYGLVDAGVCDVESIEELCFTEYDFQLVCDGLKPIYNKNGFDIQSTQEIVDEILPIGFGLYKVRKGNMWNIKSPNSPIYSYLSLDYDNISYIEVRQIPGGGPGYYYLGIEARNGCYTSYFSLENGKFKLIETLSDDEIKSRLEWT